MVFAYVAVSRPWHRWHRGRAALDCGVSCAPWGVWQHLLPLPMRCPQHLPVKTTTYTSRFCLMAPGGQNCNEAGQQLHVTEKKKKREKRQPRSLSLWPTELPWMQLSLCPACGQVPLTLPSFVSIPVSGLKRLSKEARLLHPDPRWGSHGWEGKPKVSWVWHPTPRTFCWRALSKDSTFICSFRSPAWRAALSALAFVRTWAISSLALLWKEGTKNTCLSSVMAWEPGC